MRYAISVLLVSMVASAAFAQQSPSDPIQSFINEFNAESVAHEHSAAALTAAIKAYQNMVKLLGDDEVQKQTLIEWLKQAQAKEGKTKR